MHHHVHVNDALNAAFIDEIGVVGNDMAQHERKRELSSRRFSPIDSSTFILHPHMRQIFMNTAITMNNAGTNFVNEQILRISKIIKLQRQTARSRYFENKI